MEKKCRIANNQERGLHTLPSGSCGHKYVVRKALKVTGYIVFEIYPTQ